jgi:ABC-type Fe3+-hydroxamate transport system substrate-binding protein
MSMNVQNQTGEFFFDKTVPLRIVSLVPSITELLYDLGLDEQVVGITKFCVHPKSCFQTKTRVGGTKNISIQKVIAQQPNLILTNKEENIKEQVEELSKQFPVFLTDVDNILSACDMIKQVGQLTGTGQKANVIAEDISKVLLNSNNEKKWKAIYLIWQNPYMGAGGDTFINSMMVAAGFENLLSFHNRYPVLNVDDIIKLKPEVLLLSSEPFPFKQQHAKKLKLLTGVKKVIIVDGEIFSWYGSRMLKAPPYFAKLRESLFLDDETAASI